MQSFLEVLIVVQSDHAKGISSVLETLQNDVNMKFIMCEVGEGQEAGSADALRSIRSRIKVLLIN